MVSIGSFGFLTWVIPVGLLIAGGSLGDRLAAAERNRLAGRIQLELARAALPQAAKATAVDAAVAATQTTAPTQPIPMGENRTPRLVEEGDLRTQPEITAALDRLIGRVDGLIAADDVAALRRIREAVALALVPDEGPLDLTDHETWLVRQISTDYLQRAIEHYLALPPELALEPVLDGRSARQVLDEQLALIEDRLHQMAERTYKREAGGLLDHALVGPLGHLVEPVLDQRQLFVDLARGPAVERGLRAPARAAGEIVLVGAWQVVGADLAHEPPSRGR